MHHETHSAPDQGRTHFVAWITALVHEHRARLVAIARQQGLSPEDALDCVQDAFFTFLRRPDAPSLREGTTEARRLLATLVVHTAMNQRRKLKRRAPHSEIDVPEAAADLPSSETLVEQAEVRVALVRCVERLSHMQQAVVRLRLLDDYPGEEVSSILGLSPENVRVLLFRARLQLRQCLVLPAEDEPGLQSQSPQEPPTPGFSL
jgi:RNA polymerase sigma-70 factor (ECF subfamily)